MAQKYVPAALRREVRARAAKCCEYCLIPEQFAFASHWVDHIIAKKHGEQTEVAARGRFVRKAVDWCFCMEVDMARLARARMLFVAITLAIATASTGCFSCYGPDRRVQVVLHGASDAARRGVTQTLLPAIVDDPLQPSIGWFVWGDQAPNKIDLGPVSDPKAFARRIRFGTVEKITGRTIFVKVDESKVRVQLVIVKVGRFLADLPDTIRALPFIARIKMIAWWTGKSEGDVFWSELWRMTKTVPEQ
jgi:hypothetical protein